MDDINAKILQQGFGVKLISSYRTRTGLVCRTDRGLLELKKTFSDDVSLEMEAALRNIYLPGDLTEWIKPTELQKICLVTERKTPPIPL